jgi:hypothetical protein
MSEEGEGEKDNQHIQWWNREFFEALTKEVADELGVTLEYVFGHADERAPGTFRWWLDGRSAKVAYAQRQGDELKTREEEVDVKKALNEALAEIHAGQDGFYYTIPVDREEFKRELRATIEQIRARFITA